MALPKCHKMNLNLLLLHNRLLVVLSKVKPTFASRRECSESVQTIQTLLHKMVLDLIHPKTKTQTLQFVRIAERVLAVMASQLNGASLVRTAIVTYYMVTVQDCALPSLLMRMLVAMSKVKSTFA